MFTWKTEKGSIIRLIKVGITNCYLIESNRTCIFIDTGPGKYFKKLNNFLNANLTIQNRKLDYLILTHTHYDHAGNASKVKENFNPQIIVHEKESKYLCNGFTTLPQGTNYITNFLTTVVNKYFSRIGKYEPVHADYEINVSNAIDLSNLEIIETPGHTEGSISVIIDGEMAMVGDTLFGIVPHKVFPPFADDTKALIQSWKKLLDTDATLFFPAHGQVIKRNLLESEYLKKC